MLTAVKTHTSFLSLPAKQLLRSILTASFLIILSIKLTAQERYIQGTVSNQFTLEKIPFASLVWKNTGRGTLTDSLGRFRLAESSRKTDTLLVTYVGFKNLSLPFVQGRIAGELSLLLQQGKEADSVIVSHTYNRGAALVETHRKKQTP